MKVFGRVALTALLALGGPVGGAGDTGSGSPLIVVGDFANPPFSSWNEAHEPVGIEVEILDLVCRELGRTVEWRELPFAEMLPAVENGSAHVAASTIGITEERAKRVRFSSAYHETELSVIVRADDGDPQSMDDLSGLPVGAGRSTTSEDAVRRSLPAARLVVEREGELSFGEMLLAGKLSAIVMDRPAAERLVGESADRMRILESHLGIERYAFAVNREQGEVLAAIDLVLERLRDEGRLDKAIDATAVAASADADLGLRNQRSPLPQVVSGGQPDVDQLVRASRNGFKTVINLRGPGEDGEIRGEDELVRAMGMKYVAIPVKGRDDINVENAERLREALSDPEALPALVHCASGNRIGALFALRAFHLDGRSAAEALEIGKQAGLTRAEPLVRELIGLPPAETD
jgi:uncharacterized protein (TIGR01244 family)